MSYTKEDVINGLIACSEDISGCTKCPFHDCGCFPELRDVIIELLESQGEPRGIDSETLPIVRALREKLNFYEELPNEGDTLYYVTRPRQSVSNIDQVTVSEVLKNKDGWFVIFWWMGWRVSVKLSSFGKTVFLTREAAEAALRERKKTDGLSKSADH